jgi:hypothetical protein
LSAGLGKRLAWKAGAQDVVGRNVRWLNVSNVTMRRNSKVSCVDASQFGVDLGCHNTPMPEASQCHMKAAKTGEEINESKRRWNGTLDAPPRAHVGDCDRRPSRFQSQTCPSWTQQ